MGKLGKKAKIFFSILRGLLVKSRWSSLRSTNILVVRHDADCGYKYGDKAYSPLMDSIVEICFSEDYTVQSIATPYSTLVGKHAYNNPVVPQQIEI